MAITAIHPDQTWEHIPESERESDDPTVFIYRALSAVELGQCNISASIEGFNLASANEVFRRGVCGARNFLDASGKEIEVRQKSGRVLDFSLMRQIPPGIVLELAGAILEKSYATGDDLKN